MAKPINFANVKKRHRDRLRAPSLWVRGKDQPRGRRNPEANATASRDDWIKGGETKKESVPILGERPALSRSGIAVSGFGRDSGFLSRACGARKNR